MLSVLRAMGPVVVVIDEADAALGDRDQEGDSGTSSRVFAMIASHMGDTRNTRISRESLEDVISQFMPSTAGLEKELQETTAVLECTDRQFLPEGVAAGIVREGGRQKLQERLTALRRLVESL